MKYPLALIAASLCAAPTSADIVNVRYDFPSIANSSFLYGYFGSDLGPTLGTILETRVVIDQYDALGAVVADSFEFGFDVPVLIDNTQVFLDAETLGWSGNGSFSASITTDEFNGEIREGRFGAEWIGGGRFIGDAYIEFTVDRVPAPSALALLGLGGVLSTPPQTLVILSSSIGDGSP